MNRDDIIRMAREAGLVHRDEKTQSDAYLFAMPDRIERFAALVAAHEREACARVCESSITPNIDWWNDACQRCADDIRARGEK